MGIDYYGVLGIDRRATIDDIQRAYRRLAVKYHPNRCDDFKAKVYFFNIAEAYDVLSQSKPKSIYDQYGEEGLKYGVFLPPGPLETEGPKEVYTFHGDPYKIFREFFGVDNPFAEVKLPNIDPEYKFCPVPEEEQVQGEDLIVLVPISLEEVFYGCSRVITLKQTVFSEEARKTIEKDKEYRFDIHRGCPEDRKFVFKSCGNQGRNVIPGNVIFLIKLQEHQVFQLENLDLVLKRTIPLAHALSGCVLDVQTIDSKTLHVPLTGITKPGQRVVIPGEGMIMENSQERGNLQIEIEIDFPDYVSEQQRSLLKVALLKTND